MSNTSPVCLAITTANEAEKARLDRIRHHRWFLKGDLYILPKAKESTSEQRKKEIEKTRKIVDEHLQVEIREIQDQLNIDWQEKQLGGGPGQNAVEHDVLLTGRERRKKVELSPCIWVKCKNKRFKRIAPKRLRDLTWMSSMRLRDKIKFGSEAPLFTTAPVPVPEPLKVRAGQGINLPDGFTVYVNIEKRDGADSQKDPACALLCSIMVKQHGILKYNGVCRMGGALAVKDKGGTARLVGVTTAHGLMDYFLSVGWRTSSTRSKATVIARIPRSMKSSQKERERPNREYHQSAASEAIGMIGSSALDFIKWVPAPSFYGINWLGSGWEEASQYPLPFSVSDPRRMAPDADIALLELGSEFSNSYRFTSDSASHHVEGWLLEDQLSSGPVEIIVRNDLVVQGTLLSEIPYIYLRGRRFPTRKIRLEGPLAMGTSGCWVMKDRQLCGMIVASYETEPFAHIITAEKLISDIEKIHGAYQYVNIRTGNEISLPQSEQALSSPATVSLSKDIVHPPSSADPAEKAKQDDDPASDEEIEFEEFRKDIVEPLLGKGADPKLRDKYCRALMWLAARNGDEAVVKMLLEKDVNANATSSSGLTPLSWAAENGHAKVVELLLDEKALIEARGESGQTTLSRASKNGHEAVVKLLLARGANPQSKSNSGQTPLSWAAANGHEKVIELLLTMRKRVNVNSKDGDGRTPLSWAAANGHEKVVELLLIYVTNVNSEDRDGRTPLSEAAANGHEKVIELLLRERGVELNSQDRDGRTPLFEAAANGHEKVIELLLRMKEKVDVNLKDGDGRTALSVAAANKHEKVFELLRRAGAKD